MAPPRWLLGPPDGADPDGSLAETLRAQPAAVDERRHDAVAREPVEVFARLAEPRAAQADLADTEDAVHQVVERHAAGRDVAARLGGRELDVQAAQGLGGFRLGQGDLG